MAKPAPTAHAQFTASIPENYDRYLGPVIFEPYAKDLAQRLGKTDPKNVLETACGTGIVTRRLLEALSPDAGLIATDLNPAMLDHARAAIGDDSRVSWEVSGVLSSGGRFLFNVWDEIGKNQFAMIANQTITSFWPDDPPTFYQTPFGFHDLATIKKMLEAAGFSRVREEIVLKPSQAPAAADFARGLIEGSPVMNEIQARGTATLEEVESELAARLKKNLGDRPVPVRLQAIVFQAEG
ncbi:MAG: methyltransferase domain-containing protein [Candidatus Eisenbacteria bacterium]|uniref:Methyltransferase domain-containing protein n=1 Tax=Eiseniibacteriota bacterium TaxID=2212470 RepID=A0A538T621_UNCEI|nr:MAG: methyltransferase domain-containing protein [Candidatus Eisenbacteria bacterium]